MSDSVTEDVMIRSGVSLRHVTERGNCIAQKACICRDVQWKRPYSGTRKMGILYDGAYTHPVRAYKGNGAVICRPQIDIKI